MTEETLTTEELIRQCDYLLQKARDCESATSPAFEQVAAALRERLVRERDQEREELLEDFEHVLVHFLDSSGAMSTLLRTVICTALRERLTMEREQRAFSEHAQYEESRANGAVKELISVYEELRKAQKELTDKVNTTVTGSLSAPAQPSQDKRSPG